MVILVLTHCTGLQAIGKNNGQGDILCTYILNTSIDYSSPAACRSKFITIASYACPQSQSESEGETHSCLLLCNASCLVC